MGVIIMWVVTNESKLLIYKWVDTIKGALFFRSKVLYV